MASVRTLSSFKTQLAGGGARPNLFEVSIPSFPTALTGGSADAGAAGESTEDPWSSYTENFKFLCKAAQLPASTVNPISVPFRGRTLKVAGDRTFAEWTVTIINDEDFTLRTAFEKWSDIVSNLIDNTGVTNPSSYMTNGYVKQLGRGNTAFSTKNTPGNVSVLRSYKFYDIWPSEVSEIALNYDSADTIEEFTVTFQVQYFTIGESDDTATGEGSNSGSINDESATSGGE
jgi:hypothetical protein